MAKLLRGPVIRSEAVTASQNSSIIPSVSLSLSLCQSVGSHYNFIALHCLEKYQFCNKITSMHIEHFIVFQNLLPENYLILNLSFLF